MDVVHGRNQVALSSHYQHESLFDEARTAGFVSADADHQMILELRLD